MKLIYPVVECFDKSVSTIARFTTKKAAEDFIAEQTVPGNMSGFSLGQPERVYESLKDYKENNEETIRRRALAKLSPEEKKALGVSD